MNQPYQHNPLVPVAPGYYPNIPFADYQRLPGISKSALDWFRKSPAHYADFVSGRLEREETDALRFGRIAHAAILEGRCDWVLSPFDSYRSKEAQAWRDEQTLPILTQAEADEIAGWVELVNSDTNAKVILKACEYEVSMFADDGGVRLKGRADVVAPDYFADLKFVRDASDAALSKAFVQYGYHRQAAHYLRIAKLLGKKQTRFFFVAVEKSNPPRLNVVELHPNAIDLGDWENREDIERLVKCQESGVWPGYVTGGIKLLDVPAWAHSQFANRPLDLVIGGESTEI